MANRVQITLTGEGESAEQALRGVENRMERVQRESRRTGQSMDRVNRVSSTMVSRLQGLAGAAGLVAGATGLGYMINRSLTAQEELLNLHKTTGIAIERIQEYQFAARKTGVGQERLNDAISEMSQRMGEAIADFERTGSITEMGEGFQAAGIGIRELQNLNPTQTFDRVAQAIQQAKDEQTALNIAAKTFGDENGRAMVAMFREGEKAIGEYIEQARDLGIVLDEDVVRKGAEAKKSITTLSAALESQFSRVVGNLAPAISDIADDMADWVENNQEFLEQELPDHIESIASAATYAAKEVGVLAESLGFAFGTVPSEAAKGVARAIHGSADVEERIRNRLEGRRSELARVQRGMGNIPEDREQYGVLAARAEKLQSQIETLEKTLQRMKEDTKEAAEQTGHYSDKMDESGDKLDENTGKQKENNKAKETAAEKYGRINARLKTHTDILQAQITRDMAPPTIGPDAVQRAEEQIDNFKRINKQLQTHEDVLKAQRTRDMAPPGTIGPEGMGGADDEWAEQQQERISEFEKSWQEMLDRTRSATQGWQDLVTDGFSYAINSMSRTLTEFIMTGEMQWEEFARSTIEYIMQMWIRWEMWQAAKKASEAADAAGGWGSLAANLLTSEAQGGVFQGGQKLQQYAQGAVVNQPTIFPMANGAGVMGEDGPEAVMPLERTKTGDLGVKMAKQGRGEKGEGKKVEQHFHVNVQTGPDGKIAQESMQQMQRRLARTMKRDAQRD